MFGPSNGIETLFSSKEIDTFLENESPQIHGAARSFWDSIYALPVLSARLKELIFVALYGTISTINSDATKRHVKRAIEAGASNKDIMDTLVTINGIANHAMYFSLPVMNRVMSEMNLAPMSIEPSEESIAIKQAFIKSRGVWNSQRDAIFNSMPGYFKALSQISTVTWECGSLTRKERELICIAIDCTVSHMFEPGLELHMRCALEHGATQEEIMEVFQLASAIGLEGYIQGSEAMYEISKCMKQSNQQKESN